MASRTNKPKAGSPRGQSAPRGKRTVGSKAGSSREAKSEGAKSASTKPASKTATKLTLIGGAKGSEQAAKPARAKRINPTAQASQPAPTRPRLVSVSSGIQNTSPSRTSAPPRSAAPAVSQAGPAAGWSPGERGARPDSGRAGDVFGYAAARGAPPASLTLLELNTRVLDLLRQQSQVSFSAMQAVFTATSVAGALRAQADGISRVLDLQKAQWLEMTSAFGRTVEDAARPVRTASLWRVP